jgi:hypothetical protein
MKNFLLLLLVCCCINLNAQRLKILENTITENGKQIAKFEKTTETFTVVANLDEDELLNIETLTDDELHLDYNLINFSDDNQSQAYLPYSKKINVLEILLKANVLKEGVLNAEAIKIFCAKNTVDALQKKPLAKQAKELSKEEKAALKAEQNEEKDFAVQEKMDKKQAVEDKKWDKQETKTTSTIPTKPNVKLQKTLDAADAETNANENIRSTKPTISLKQNNIFADEKQIAFYTELEGTVNGKKGKIYTFYDSNKKRIAVVKLKNYTTDAEIENTTTKAKTIFTLSGNTDKTLIEQIVTKLTELNIF